MSLFGSIQLASGSLRANDIALQVVGQNIANANTPGYIRESANFVPGPTQSDGALVSGTGVVVQSITQQIDKFLEGRLRSASSDQASSDTLKGTYTQLENILGGLNSGSNVTSALNQFFASISNVLNQPESASLRQLATLQGQSLAKSINDLAGQTSDLRTSVNDQVENLAPTINRLTSQIAQLNAKISQTTGGSQLPSDAVGLADQRNQAVGDLAKIVGGQVTTQLDGTVSVYVNGSYLVDEGTSRGVHVAHSTDRGQTISTIEINDINTPLDPASGQLNGLINSRDQVLGGFTDQLNAFAGTLANEFNKVYSGGQGLSAYSQATSLNAVADANVPLNQAGLDFTPTNGSFQITTKNQQTGASTTTDIPVALLGPAHNTTLNSLTAAIDRVGGLKAQVVGGKLSISATDANTQFTFGKDTSGTLAALGLNTFFTGSSAGNLGINAGVLKDPGKFAASTTGVGTDTTNAQALANFLTKPLLAQGGDTLQNIFTSITTTVTQSSANAKANADAADTLQTTLATQQQATSGVNLDEEAINMLAYQRAYQASAKFISTVNDLLNLLVQL